MYKKVDFFIEPRFILDQINEPFVEMSEDEHGFLCGLIKKVQPKKIVEIGVAGGGTTAVIMNCLSMMDSDAKMYSIDVNKKCYKRKDKKTGWQLEEVKDQLANYQNHTFLLGKRLPQIIHGLGDDIDFVILDTEHSLPGELLEFLCILPRMPLGSIVVLHDIGLNLYGDGNAIATKILLDAVSGIKYVDFEKFFPNIGAFEITKETTLNIENVFSALSITWSHLVDISVLLDYRNVFGSFYPKECLWLFDQIVLLQYQHFYKSRSNVEKEMEKLLRLFDDEQKVYLYGAGIRGRQLKRFILQRGYHIDGFVVSDSYDPKDFRSVDRTVYRMSEVPEAEYHLILSTPAQEVFYGLLERGMRFVYFSEDFFEQIKNVEM